MMKVWLQQHKGFFLASALVASLTGYYFWSRPQKISDVEVAVKFTESRTHRYTGHAKKQNNITSATEKNQENTGRQNHRLPSGQHQVIPSGLLEHPLLLGTRWKIWPNTQAIKNERVSVSDVVLAKVSNLAILESNSETPDLQQFDSAQPVVIFDPRLKKTGVITGTLKVVTSDRQQLENDLTPLRAHITDAFDDISTYFVTSTDQIFDLISLFNSLKSKPHVKTIELDVISRTYEKL